MFGKNRTKTAEEVLDIIKGLSEEEKAKVLVALKPPETEDEVQIDEAEEYIDERGEEDGTADQTESDVLDESVGEPEVKNDEEDRYAALTARIAALEAEFRAYREAQEQAVEEERDRDFGMSPSTPDGGQEDEDRYKRVMRGYAKNNSNQYL